MAIGELRRDPKTGRLNLRDYRPDRYPAEDFNHRVASEALDPRRQHWYVDAAKTRRQTWSRTYILEDVEGSNHVPGVSCSTPFFADDGTLRGVATTSFDVLSLSDYLRSLKVGEGGFAFIIENRRDGLRRVVSHPDKKILTRRTGVDEVDHDYELVPIEEFADPRVIAFAGGIPDKVEPGSVRQPVRLDFALDGTPLPRRLSEPDDPE